MKTHMVLLILFSWQCQKNSDYARSTKPLPQSSPEDRISFSSVLIDATGDDKLQEGSQKKVSMCQLQ